MIVGLLRGPTLAEGILLWNDFMKLFAFRFVGLDVTVTGCLLGWSAKVESSNICGVSNSYCLTNTLILPNSMGTTYHRYFVCKRGS